MPRQKQTAGYEMTTMPASHHRKYEERMNTIEEEKKRIETEKVPSKRKHDEEEEIPDAYEVEQDPVEFAKSYMEGFSDVDLQTKVYLQTAGTFRLSAISQGKVEINDSDSTKLIVDYFETKRKKIPEREQVDLLSKNQLSAFYLELMKRTVTKSRPIPKKLTKVDIAEKSPPFFWSIYYHYKKNIDEGIDILHEQALEPKENNDENKDEMSEIQVEKSDVSKLMTFLIKQEIITEDKLKKLAKTDFASLCSLLNEKPKTSVKKLLANYNEE